MEWTIPIQKLELSKIIPGSFQNSSKPITPLEYKDATMNFKHLNILLPPLIIKDYDTESGKLSIHLPEQSAIYQKLLALHDSLLTLLHQHQKVWFTDSNRTKEQIEHFFQPFVQDNNLLLYCPLQSQEKKFFLHLWKDGSWKKLSSPGLLQKGDIIRVALRLQGI